MAGDQQHSGTEAQCRGIQALYITSPAELLKTPLGSVPRFLMLRSAGAGKAWCMHLFKLTKEWAPSNLAVLQKALARLAIYHSASTGAWVAQAPGYHTRKHSESPSSATSCMHHCTRRLEGEHQTISTQWDMVNVHAHPHAWTHRHTHTHTVGGIS